MSSVLNAFAVGTAGLFGPIPAGILARLKESNLGVAVRSRSLDYMPGLDGLRAVAVGMVFYVHAFPFGNAFPGGLGVDVFFVISGFLITLILMKEIGRSGTVDLKSFYVKRLLRLYPALILMTAVVVALYIVYERGIPGDKLLYAGIALTYLSNIHMTLTGAMIDPLSHTWSLAMEEQFYLLWPPVLLLLVKLKMPRWAMITLVSALAVASLVGWFLTAHDAPYNPLTKTGGLFVGCAVALIVGRTRWQHAGLAYLAMVTAVAVLILETAGVIGRDVSMPIITLLLPLIILHVAHGQGPVVRVLTNPVFMHLGVVSYGIYLWHYPILYVLRSVGIAGLAGAGLGLALTLVAAEVSFRFVERPALRLKDKMRAKEPAEAG